MAEKYVRFVTYEVEPVTGERIGFFKAAYALRRVLRATPVDSDRLDKLLNWLDDHLDAPDRFSKSQKPRAHGKAFSWFKPEASEHISHSRDLLEILKRYGIQSEMLTTANPGMIVYEDDHQLAAIPFREKDF